MSDAREEATARVKVRLEARENILRESWVKAMRARLVLEELGKCQRGEGVNHYENCRWLAEKFLDMKDQCKLKGYRRIDVEWTITSSKTGPPLSMAPN